ncbi:erythromycin esterase family protein [Amycolatopsis pittospori]|uniref:erythromycin esterase family protein n=1 Tax=Amycolatopsis pittospori TaxID=2749434 RepID=UPI0015F042E9|nr:erythromycin esterase family protein [Amycolatopsis pittospori]
MARLTADAVIPLGTLDPAAPLDDLDWLGKAIGDARVVAIGESSHYNHEFVQLRHRVLRYLVERQGFKAFAFESGFAESRLVGDWVHGGEQDLGHVLANGMTSLTGLWTEVRDQLTWLRDHPVGCYGIDLGGSNISLLPGLDVVLGYLAAADPDFEPDPAIRTTASAFAAESPFSIPAAIGEHGKLPAEAKDALTARLAGLATHFSARRLDYSGRTGVAAYEHALLTLRTVITLDAVVRAMTAGDMRTALEARDATIADTVEQILRHEDRIVLGAHNGHVQRWRGTMPGVPPAAPMGLFLADRFGADYLAIGTTSGTGEILSEGPDFYAGKFFSALEAPRPDSLDGVLDASHDGLFATDLRSLSERDTATLRAVTEQRMGSFYSGVNALDAFDILVHVPRVSPAEPDLDALEHAPDEAREMFAKWIASRGKEK